MQQQLPLSDLRKQWAEAWGKTPHARIGRGMLEASLAYKQRELTVERYKTVEQARISALVKQYKRNPKSFHCRSEIKPGTRLVKHWNGTRYSVLATETGYEYGGEDYSSLSQVALKITGTRWNGWSFFGLKGKAA